MSEYSSFSQGSQRNSLPPQQQQQQQFQYTAYGTASSGSANDSMKYLNNYQEPMGEPLLMGERRKNFPPCYPVVHHNIATDIEPDKRAFVRRGYLAWYVHSFALFWNFVCLTGALFLGLVVSDFFYALLAFVLGAPISFYVYWFLYSAVRKFSASYYVLWFVCFALQVVAEILFGIGLFGGAGFLLMIKAFDKNTVLGIMCVITFFLWIGLFVHNAFYFNSARVHYQNLGGNRQATKEFTQGAVQVAYDNRDTIKQVAVENKDVIIDVARENRKEIQQVAYENREMVARVAVENKDTIWENRDAVQDVFKN